MFFRKVKTTRFERTGRVMWINVVAHFYKCQDYMLLIQLWLRAVHINFISRDPVGSETNP